MHIVNCSWQVLVNKAFVVMALKHIMLPYKFNPRLLNRDRSSDGGNNTFVDEFTCRLRPVVRKGIYNRSLRCRWAKMTKRAIYMVRHMHTVLGLETMVLCRKWSAEGWMTYSEAVSGLPSTFLPMTARQYINSSGTI